jgi:hypothetical protein
MALTREERIEEARKRTRNNVENRDSYGVHGKTILDFEKIGGYKKSMSYKPKPGLNHVDFVPFMVKSDKHPRGVKAGNYEYILDIFVHRGVGPAKDNFICLQATFGKPCPICEAREILKLDPEAKEDEIKALYPKARCWYNVIDLDSKDPNQPVQIFEESKFLFEKEMLEFITSKNEFDFWDYEVGKSLEFFASENKSDKGSYLKYKQFHLDQRPVYNPEICDEAYDLIDLLHIPTYDEVQMSFLGDDKDLQPKAQAEQPQSTPQRSRGQAVEQTQPEQPARQRRTIQDEIKEEQKEMTATLDNSRRRQRPAAPAEAVQEKLCSLGHKFGVENNVHSQDCAKCPAKEYDECADEHDRINATRG